MYKSVFRPLNQLRCIHHSIPFFIKANQLPPRPKINEEDIQEVFLKGGGKGGQKINKTNSKVQLKHIPTGLVVSSQFSRSREQNRARAREILALKVEDILLGSESRVAVVADYKRNKARKKKSKARKKYQKMAALSAEDAQDAENQESCTQESKKEPDCQSGSLKDH